MLASILLNYVSLLVALLVFRYLGVENENHAANEMNIFFARFETIDFVQEVALEL